MIIPDQKKTVSIILSRMGKNGATESTQEIKPEHEMRDDDESFRVIAEDIMQAIEDKSTSDLAHALKTFLEQHELSRYSEKDE